MMGEGYDPSIVRSRTDLKYKIYKLKAKIRKLKKKRKK